MKNIILILLIIFCFSFILKNRSLSEENNILKNKINKQEGYLNCFTDGYTDWRDCVNEFY